MQRTLGRRYFIVYCLASFCGLIVLPAAPDAAAALQRVNLGVYGGLVNDIASLATPGTSTVFAAVECNRGIFRWSATAAEWSAVTYPGLVGNGKAVEASRNTARPNDVYAILELSNTYYLAASTNRGALGSWFAITNINRPAVLEGHASGMYIGTSEGRIYRNAGAANGAFDLIYIHPYGREVSALSIYDTNRLFGCLTFNAGQTNVFQLVWTGAYQQIDLNLPAATASGNPDVRINRVGVAPWDSNVVYLAGSANGNSQIYRSTNGGFAWERSWDKYMAGTNYYPGGFPYLIKFNNERTFIGTHCMLNGGAGWSSCGNMTSIVGTARGATNIVETHPNDPGTEIDAINSNTVYVSTDWGIGQTTCSLAGVWGWGTEMGNNRGITAVVLNDFDFYTYSATNKDLWIAAKSGIGKALRFNPADLSTTAGGNDWLFPLYPDGAPATEITIHPTNPAIVLAGYNSGRIFKSVNATAMTATGITWSQVFFAGDWPSVFGSVQNDSIIKAIDFVPSQPEQVFMGGYRWQPPVTNGGVFYSGDAGSTWSNEAAGYPVNALFVSDYAVWAGVGGAESAARGLRARQAPGNWWQPRTYLKLDDEIVTDLAGVMLNGTVTVYAVTYGGVYKGVLTNTACPNGFDCWIWEDLTANIGAPVTDFTAVCICPTDADLAYVSAANYIYRTTDGGGAWSLLPGTGSASHENVNVLKYDDFMEGSANGLYDYPNPVIHYVAAGWTNPVAPYTNWLTAAATIQDAVDIAGSNALVLVSNGVYNSGGRVQPGYILTNRVYITNSVTVESINGPAVTIIAGAALLGDGAVRGVFITNGGVLAGFTITNGSTRAAGTGDPVYDQRAGGVLLAGSGLISNCVIRNGAAAWYAGGVYCMAGGTVANCEILDNQANRAGGIYCSLGGLVRDCVISGNRANDDGGGIRFYGGGEVQRSIISYNIVSNSGGGAYCYDGGKLSACVITHNVGTNLIACGGGLYFLSSGMAVNCLITKNSVNAQGGGAYLQSGGTLVNCTIVENSADQDGGGVGNDGGGVYCLNGGTNRNCVIYFNKRFADTFDSNWETSGGGVFEYCCTTNLPAGAGNFLADPRLINRGAGNYLLAYGSPCIDSGTNLPTVLTDDIDGVPRPQDGNYDGQFIYDVGAYEYYPATAETDGDGMLDWWEREYGLDPTNAADAAWDKDSDRFINLHEFLADTIPTNNQSYLGAEITAPSGPGACVITWRSVTSRTYSVWRGTNLIRGDWIKLLTNRPAVDNSWTDAPPAEAPAWFYRVGTRR